MSLVQSLQLTKISILHCSKYYWCNSVLRVKYKLNFPCSQRTLSTSTQSCASIKVGEDAKFLTTNNNESLISKVLKKIPFINLQRHKLGVSGYLLYESVADNINYNEFFDEFALPDTFYSWFVITEIHVWMLMVRCMAEGEDGRVMRNSVVQAMWADVALRAKKLGAHNPSGVREQIRQLSEQFQAALIAYDEGLQSDDITLAGAIWRRLYQQQEANPEHLDCMVKYIRKQVRYLDNISHDELFSQKKINWEALQKK